MHARAPASSFKTSCGCSSSDEEQDDVLEGVSDGESTATSLPNDGEADDATTPNAPSSSHKGILYCQVSCLLVNMLCTMLQRGSLKQCLRP